MADTTEIDIVISANLRRLIGDEYGAQIAVAREVSIQPGTLNRIMKCKAHAGPKVVADLARALGVSEIELYQPHNPAPAEDPIAVKMAVYNQEIADAGRHMTRMSNEIEALKTELAVYKDKWDRFAHVPSVLLEKLLLLDWSTRGIVSHLKLAMRPFLKGEKPIRRGRKKIGSAAGTG